MSSSRSESARRPPLVRATKSAMPSAARITCVRIVSTAPGESAAKRPGRTGPPREARGPTDSPRAGLRPAPREADRFVAPGGGDESVEVSQGANADLGRHVRGVLEGIRDPEEKVRHGDFPARRLGQDGIESANVRLVFSRRSRRSATRPMLPDRGGRLRASELPFVQAVQTSPNGEGGTMKRMALVALATTLLASVVSASEETSPQSAPSGSHIKLAIITSDKYSQDEKSVFTPDAPKVFTVYRSSPVGVEDEGRLVRREGGGARAKNQDRRERDGVLVERRVHQLLCLHEAALRAGRSAAMSSTSTWTAC